MSFAGDAKNHLGSSEEAVAWCRRSIEANRNYPNAHFMLAAALAQLGRLDEARSAVKAGLALDPKFTVSRPAGYGFSIRSENKRPLVTLSFATREDAEQARAEVASAVEKAIEVTPQG
jgi:tetratricopeptide (TPR) repeat protein